MKSVHFYLGYTYNTSGQLEKVVDVRIDNPGGENMRETLQNFIYRPDGTILSFDVNITTINELQYVSGFLPGEKIYAEKWSTRPGNLSLTERRMKDGFSPVLMPTYVEGLPSVTFPTYINMFSELFMYKYVYAEEVRGYGNTEAATTTFPEFSYSCDENGQLEEFVYKEYPNNNYYWQYFRFEY